MDDLMLAFHPIPESVVQEGLESFLYRSVLGLLDLW